MRFITSLFLIATLILNTCSCITLNNQLPVGPDGAPETRQGVLPTSSFFRIEKMVGADLVGMGSGFVTRQGREGVHIVTANHVCEDSPSAVARGTATHQRLWINVRSFDNEVAEAVVLKTDSVNDLCLLYAKNIFKPAVRIASKVPKIGDKVFVIGSPLGFYFPEDGTVPIISGIYNGLATLDGTRFQIYTARIAPGNSGGMVVNEYGEVIGISNFGWFMRNGYNDICGGSRLDTIKTFLK